MNVNVVALEGRLHVPESLQDLSVVLGDLEQLHSVGIVHAGDADQVGGRHGLLEMHRSP